MIKDLQKLFADDVTKVDELLSSRILPFMDQQDSFIGVFNQTLCKFFQTKLSGASRRVKVTEEQDSEFSEYSVRGTDVWVQPRYEFEKTNAYSYKQRTRVCGKVSRIRLHESWYFYVLQKQFAEAIPDTEKAQMLSDFLEVRDEFKAWVVTDGRENMTQRKTIKCDVDLPAILPVFRTDRTMFHTSHAKQIHPYSGTKKELRKIPMIEEEGTARIARVELFLDMERVLKDIPEDPKAIKKSKTSAEYRVPKARPLTLCALDEDDNLVLSMRIPDFSNEQASKFSLPWMPHNLANGQRSLHDIAKTCNIGKYTMTGWICFAHDILSIPKVLDAIAEMVVEQQKFTQKLQAVKEKYGHFNLLLGDF